MTRLRGTLFALFTGVILVGAILLFSSQGQAAPGPADPKPLVEAPPSDPIPTRGPAPQVAEAGAPTLLTAEFNDINDTSTWTVMEIEEVAPGMDKPTWKIREGMLVQTGTGEAAIHEFIKTAIATGDESWQDYTLTANAYPVQNDQIGLVFRVQGNDHYRFRMVRDLYAGPRLILEKVVKGRVTELASAEHAGFTNNQWYTLAVTAKGSNFTVSVNGTPVLSASDATLSHGKIGLFAIATGQLFYDNIAVTAAE